MGAGSRCWKAAMPDAVSENEVRLAVRTLLPGGYPTLKGVAGALGLSKRTLQRRLADAGLTHTGLVTEVRHDLALELLARPGVSIKQVARRTGFANPSGFSRAFSAWTGMSPRDYRRQRPIGAN